MDPFIVILELARSVFGIVAEEDSTPEEFVLTYPAVVNGVVIVPVNVGEADGALAAIEFVTVVANAASPPKASDNSFNVLSVVGAELTKFDIAVSV